MSLASNVPFSSATLLLAISGNLGREVRDCRIPQSVQYGQQKQCRLKSEGLGSSWDFSALAAAHSGEQDQPSGQGKKRQE